MNCYLCDTGEHPGGMRFHVRQAIGVCQHCGVGVCGKHGTKAETPGNRLLCADCVRSQAKAGQRAA